MKEKTFEEKIKRVEEVINLLEDNKQPLEKSTILFQEAMELINLCEGELSKTEDKINKVISKNDDISIIEE